MGWLHFSETEWRAHRLNQIAGWMAVLFWGTIALLLFSFIVLGFFVYERGLSALESELRVPEMPLWLNTAGWFSAPLISGVFLLAVWQRFRFTAELNVVLMLVSYGLFFTTTDFSPSAEDGMDQYVLLGEVVGGAFVVIEFAILAYLFLGARPNMMFKRRERITG